MKHLLRLLEYLGLIDCAHAWDNWKPEVVDYVYDNGRIEPDVASGYQIRTCNKCNFRQRKVIW